jgi:16S rRNA A1518/A1519 N6-dimethyltransferase RsmA/KsgA/DIM1 with predicted DNA glycosylase/AP lyase activity
VSGRWQRARRAELSQHYLRSDSLARSLVGLCGIRPDDLVVEAGPGRGALTRALAETGCRIVAVELDPDLAARLGREFRDHAHVKIVAGDFLSFPCPDSRYKFVASIPFARTADIVRRLAFGKFPPVEASIIVQREAAARFAGYPYGPETVLSLSLKPHWHMEIVAWLNPVHFDPPPRVDSVLLRLARRPSPLLASDDYREFTAILRRAYSRGSDSLVRSLRGVLTEKQVLKLTADLGLPVSLRPSDVSFQQWLVIFRLRQWLNS